MGIGIIAILAPAVAMIMPDRITSWLPAHSDSSGGVSISPAMASVDRNIQLSEAAPTNPPTTEMAASSLETAPSREVDAASETTTPSTVNHEESHGSPDDESSTGNQNPSSTTQSTNPPKSTTSTSSDQASKTITGQACPCEVTGTVELKGNVSLEGDLIVDGGTLIARPGVDVNGNGNQILFKNGGKADFQGSKVFTWSDRGAKQNLQRDINFRNMRRIIWMGNGGASTLKFFTVSDSGTSNLGDYPLHWHLNGDSTRGTIVEGVVVIDGMHHAYVPHGSNGITFRDVIAKNIHKDAFWWDPPGTNNCSSRDKFCTADNSNDTTYDHALVDGVSIPHGQNGYHTVGAFQLGAGSSNTIRNSTAINISGGQNCSGFKWPSHANQNAGGNVWSFSNNFSRSGDCHGIRVWQNDSNRHVITNFAGSGISHGAYGNDYEYRNFDVPYFDIHASGWSAHDGRIGTVVARRHKQRTWPTATFTNVTIERFVIDNAGDEPGQYLLDNSGLTCGEIEYQDVEPGTEVFIDGQRCPIEE